VAGFGKPDHANDSRDVLRVRLARSIVATREQPDVTNHRTLAVPALLGLLVSGCATPPIQPSPPSASVAAALAVPAAAPPKLKNVIVMIGDGMGYNHLDLASLYHRGTSAAQVAVDPGTGVVTRQPSTPDGALADFDQALAMRTSQAGREYEPAQAWSSFRWVLKKPTDSAAAATAIATGTKTRNGSIGVDVDKDPLTNLTETAIGNGRAAGVVTSVAFSHATPAAFSAHDTDRGDYADIANDQLRSGLTVVMGAGHPQYTKNHNKRSKARYTYLSKAAWTNLRKERTPFTLTTSLADFEALTEGDTPERVFGVAQVASTLQQKRSGSTRTPYAAKRNGVPTLATMTRGALNVLDNDPNGLFLMVEGGAIDWAAHANQTGRVIEETQSFLDSVAAVEEWVETNSSWDETLLVVTADHETGYLTGRGANPGWTPITGAAGTVPAVTWRTDEHTASLVPFYARGLGSTDLAARATHTDPVRGRYLDNTALAKVVRALWG
jgi:alkaline phosphatase